MGVDKTELLEWLRKEFYVAKSRLESCADLSDRRFQQGQMTAYQYLKFALDTGEIKETK